MSPLTEIKITGLSKKFRNHWLFKDLDESLISGERLAVLGSNGSGKSTFLKIVSGYMGPTNGNIVWTSDKKIEPSQWHRHFNYCAPYQELIEEFSLQESIDFHFSLNKIRTDINVSTLLEQVNLINHRNKIVGRFSSGMKQRLKLVLTLASDSDVYFLDEPCSNLDAEGMEWYQVAVKNIPKKSIVVIASNSPKEYEICNRYLNLKPLK